MVIQEEERYSPTLRLVAFRGLMSPDRASSVLMAERKTGADYLTFSEKGIPFPEAALPTIDWLGIGFR